MKKLLFLIPLIIACSREDSDCKQTWEYTEYCKKTYDCGSCQLESSSYTKTREFKCDEVAGIKEGTEVHLSERDDSCFKFYRRYIKRIK